MVPPVTALARRLFRFALDRRRDLRRALRPFRRQFLLSSPLVIAITWPWYKFRFRFSRVRFLRQLQFFLRDHLGGGQRAVVSRHNLLLGGWNGMSGFDFAMRSAKHLDPSTRLEDSFYDELLTSYNTDGGAALSEETIRSSGYFQRISLAARMSGHYRGVNDDEGLVQVTREYLDRYRGEPIKYRPGRSRPGTARRNALPGAAHSPRSDRSTGAICAACPMGRCCTCAALMPRRPPGRPGTSAASCSG